VNVASVLGTTSYPGAAVYSASKAYVTNFSESLWWEYKTKGIYVVGFCPGPTYTEFHNAAGGDKNNFPRFVMQSGEQVAKRLVHALLKRSRPKIVSGNFSHAMIFLQKLMTRTMAVNMMGSFTPIKDSAE
jgi:short-subunit dehydrogenase